MAGRDFIQRMGSLGLVAAFGWLQAGCRSAADYRSQADQVTGKIITAEQKRALGHAEPFTIERPSDTLRRMLLKEQDLPVAGPASYGADRLKPIKQKPEADYPKTVSSKGPITKIPKGKPLTLSLVDALEVAARNSRSYQNEKEKVFQSALSLSLEIHQFQNTYQGLIQSIFSADQRDDIFTRLQSESSLESDWNRRLKSGATLSARIVLDLAELLKSGQVSSAGIAADASVTIPLLRGSGRFVVTEPLTQAERNVIYAIWGFERYRRTFVVGIVSQYFSVLQAQDQVKNAENNYANQILARRRQQALAEEGRVGQEQLDQARQAELSSRNTWISAQQRYQNSLDAFKMNLGLPTDAKVVADRQELDRLSQSMSRRLGQGMSAGMNSGSGTNSEQSVPGANAPVHLEPASTKGAGPYEIPETNAVDLALTNRLDLRMAEEQVYDAQRGVAIAADALRAGLSLTGNGSISDRRSLGSPGAAFNPSGTYSAGLALDLPFERTAERNAYRNSYISLEQATRNAQSTEDQVKQEIRGDLRDLVEQRESWKIQLLAREVAKRRVDRTQAILELGRTGVTARDVNEAQAAYLQAQNSVTSALISYHISELALLRDMGILQVNPKGLYKETDPMNLTKRQNEKRRKS